MASAKGKEADIDGREVDAEGKEEGVQGREASAEGREAGVEREKAGIAGRKAYVEKIKILFRNGLSKQEYSYLSRATLPRLGHYY